MEVTRTPADDAADLKVRQYDAQRMLRGDMSDDELEEYVRSRVLTTTLDAMDQGLMPKAEPFYTTLQKVKQQHPKA